MDETGKGLVTVFGGSGFIGNNVTQEIARLGYRVRVAVRRPDLAGEVRMFGFPGQVQPVQANLRNKASVLRAAAGADVVVNLTGILNESGRQRFMAVHATGARNVAEAAAEVGAARLVHMSALGADADSPSAYARSKALGEAEVFKAFPEAVIFRPSLVFGRDDGFFNLFGEIARLSPVLPLIGGASRFQPVYVGDVAEAFTAAVAGVARPGMVYELGGPEVETMRELLERLLTEIQRRPMLLPIGPGLARFMGSIAQLSPWKLFTADQAVLLQKDNVVSDAAARERRTLAGLGIAATAMDVVLPTYLWRFRRNGQFDRANA
ncbi:MAG: complex I NDUFA9 subunit family protein [Alphaproteobacteria bacterium]|nr:complex I NDUFA9 subunit family protein [Alphaproteobacteria bacterium]